MIEAIAQSLSKLSYRGLIERSTKSCLHFLCLVMWCYFSNATLYQDLSSLEKSVVDQGLVVYNLRPISDLSNRIIDKIYVITVSPFSSDAAPLNFLNYLHINTKEDVIRRGLFLKTGEVFDSAAVLDSELVLRGQSKIRSLAVIVPVLPEDSTEKNKVDLLVATKDILSLQPIFSFNGSSIILTDLTLGVRESNVLGYNKSLAAIYELQQGLHLFSSRYFDPELFKTRLQLNINPSVLLARNSGSYEGFFADFKLERPLLSEVERIGYGLEISGGTRPIIDFNGDKVRTVDITSDGSVKAVERRYRFRYGKGSIFGRYSFGRTFKKEVFIDYNLNIKRPAIIQNLNLTEAQKEIFKKNVLPQNEVESFVTLGFAYFHNQFLTLYDYEKYKLQEVKRKGPILTISNDFSSEKLLLSDHNFLRPKIKASFLQTLYRDSFAQASVSTSNRYDGSFSDNVFKYGLSLVSPTLFGLGRLVLEGRLSTIYNSRDNQKIVLGSDSGVRGVDSRFYSGDKGFRTNVELRSSPVDVWIFSAGLVAFYDAGAAFNQWKANATHAIGIGLRVLAPQISSEVFRLDFAFPIYGIGKDYHVVVPSFGTGQAF